MGHNLIDLGVVPSESSSSSAEAGNTSAIEKAVAELIVEMSLSHQSVSYAVNSYFHAGSVEGKPFVIEKCSSRFRCIG